MKLENKTKRYIKNVKNSNNAVEKQYFLYKLKLLEKVIIQEYKNKMDHLDDVYIMGGFYNSNGYFIRKKEIKKEIEQKYNCKIIDLYENININFNI